MFKWELAENVSGRVVEEHILITLCNICITRNSTISHYNNIFTSQNT